MYEEISAVQIDTSSWTRFNDFSLICAYANVKLMREKCKKDQKKREKIYKKSDHYISLSPNDDDWFASLFEFVHITYLSLSRVCARVSASSNKRLQAFILI